MGHFSEGRVRFGDGHGWSTSRCWCFVGDILYGALHSVMPCLATCPEPALMTVYPAPLGSVADRLNCAILEFHHEPKESRLHKLCQVCLLLANALHITEFPPCWKHAIVIEEELQENELPGAALLSMRKLVSGEGAEHQAGLAPMD